MKITMHYSFLVSIMRFVFVIPWNSKKIDCSDWCGVPNTSPIDVIVFYYIVTMARFGLLFNLGMLYIKLFDRKTKRLFFKRNSDAISFYHLHFFLSHDTARAKFCIILARQHHSNDNISAKAVSKKLMTYKYLYKNCSF